MKNYYTEKEVKEKAREIYDKMCYNLMVDGGSSHEESIKCALVLVDEQINECLDGFLYTDYRKNFWEDVKNELKDKIDNLSELKSNDFESACRPLMKYLCENHHPHMKVIVEGNCAVLLEGEKCFNTNEYILD